MSYDQLTANLVSECKAKDAEIAALRAEAEQLRADAIRTQNEVVMPLRERISQLLAVPIIAERDALRAEVAGLRELMRSVVTELDDDDPNGPGHAHQKPGVWDESNKSNLAGRPCKWCALWAGFKLAARKGEA